MKTWQKIAVVGLVALGVASLSGCEDEESNDLARAQACMDGITSANYPTADTCMAMIAKYDSQQANILKCAISFLDGGLTTSKVSEAYKQIAINSATVSNEAMFMTVLALTPASAATDAQVYCERSGLKGLIYLANLAVVGSTMAAVIDGLGAGGYDPADPTSIPSEAEVNEAVDSCKPDPASECGSTEYEAIGDSIVSLSETYCTGENADTAICTKVGDAIDGAAGDSVLVAKQLLCLLSNPPAGATYDPNAGGAGIEGCVP